MGMDYGLCLFGRRQVCVRPWEPDLPEHLLGGETPERERGA